MTCYYYNVFYYDNFYSSCEFYLLILLAYVALPLLLKATRKPESLTVDPKVLIDFLAGIVRARKLNVEDVDVVWKENWERWLINDRLALFEAGGRGGDGAVSCHEFVYFNLIMLPLGHRIGQYFGTFFFHD